MENFEKVKRSKKDIIINNFLGGISWGLGATIGLSIVLAILTFIFSKINLVPVVGTFVVNVIDFILKYNQQIK